MNQTKILRPQLPIDIQDVPGFLAIEEGEALYEAALSVADRAPCLEVGSYCGRSTLWLASACKARDGALYAVDHHQGSEEHQPGEEYHDSSLYDQETGTMDSFKSFRRNIHHAGLENTVIPIVAPSAVAAKGWATPLSLVFIDGGHSREAALTDYRAWAKHIVSGGLLAIHDLFEDPAQGGQAPYEIYCLAKNSGLFEEQQRVHTLGILRRLGA